MATKGSGGTKKSNPDRIVRLIRVHPGNLRFQLHRSRFDISSTDEKAHVFRYAVAVGTSRINPVEIKADYSVYRNHCRGRQLHGGVFFVGRLVTLPGLTRQLWTEREWNSDVQGWPVGKFLGVTVERSAF
jgi:hypothetical protein